MFEGHERNTRALLDEMVTKLEQEQRKRMHREGDFKAAFQKTEDLMGHCRRDVSDVAAHFTHLVVALTKMFELHRIQS